MKTKQVFHSLLFGLVLALMPGISWAEVSQPDLAKRGALASRIDYIYVGNLQQRDDAGRLLVWEGTIEGAFVGTMRWWFGASPVPNSNFGGGRVAYYVARWEILDGDVVVIAGESAGKTVIPTGADGMWDGHGVVTEGVGPFSVLKGRKIYETGPVVFTTSPISGTGMFVIE